MAKKYHIAAKAAPPRFTIIGRHGIVDFNEDCAGACHHCVKKECIYDIYKKEGIFTREMQGAAALPLQLHELPALRAELHPRGRDADGQPGVPLARRQLLEARDPAEPLVPVGDRQDPRLRRRLPRAVLRPRLRRDVDGHVRDRAPDPRRHPRPRVHQHLGRPGREGPRPGVRREGPDLHRRPARARAAGAVRAGEPALRRFLAAGLRGGRPRGARDGHALRDRPGAGHREPEAVPGGAGAGA